jgi:DNA-binding transcriptional MerR regulator
VTVQDEPLYNLKAVVQQTGLKPDTLRAWERRYGLPAPQRSAGRHRLYSRHDIETVKWLVARQEEGLSIRRAVDLWHQIESDGRDPLASLDPMAPSTRAITAAQVTGETLAQLRDSWINACLAFDEQRTEQATAQAFALYPPEIVTVELLQKAVSEIGERWYQGGITVQQEHFCTGLAIRRLESLVMAAPPPTRPGRILAACPPDENHVFGLLLLTFLLRRQGWGVVYLGANVPAERLETTVATVRPRLMILAAQRLQSAASLLDVAHSLQPDGPPLAFGGLIYNLLPALRDSVPGTFLGERLVDAPQVVESLMTAPRAIPAVASLPEHCLETLRHFEERRPLIEAQLLQTTEPIGVTPNYLTMANRELASNISAALALGDLDYLGTDIHWVRGLIDHYELPAESLRSYLAAYRQAVSDNLDDRAKPILDWLDRANTP